MAKTGEGKPSFFVPLFKGEGAEGARGIRWSASVHAHLECGCGQRRSGIMPLILSILSSCPPRRNPRSEKSFEFKGRARLPPSRVELKAVLILAARQETRPPPPSLDAQSIFCQNQDGLDFLDKQFGRTSDYTLDAEWLKNKKPYLEHPFILSAAAESSFRKKF